MSKHSDLRAGFKDGRDAVERPACVTEDHLNYLDALRDSGAVNMFGCRPYLMDEFPDLSDKDAATVVGYWMKSFSERHPRTKGK